MAALDWLFDGAKLPVKGTKIVFSATHGELTLMVIQNQAGPEVIIGNFCSSPSGSVGDDNEEAEQR